MPLLNKVNKDLKKATRKMAHTSAYINEIIKDQERLLEVSVERITGINKDLKAYRFRLKPYTGTNPKARDEKYYEMKDLYEDALQERKVLQNTIQVIEESITGAQLNTLPGQAYQKGNQL